MDEARSAVIVPIAIPRRIEAIRRRSVPVASLGVPPHVTLLSPFLAAARLDTAVRSTLNGALAAHPLFEAVFANVARFDDALYLVPEPDEPFRSLIVAICRAFPDMPPYGEPSYRPEDVVPHLTVAIGNGTGFDDLAAETEPCLPFSRRVSSVAVVTERPGGTWKTRWRLSLTAVRP